MESAKIEGTKVPFILALFMECIGRHGYLDDNRKCKQLLCNESKNNYRKTKRK